MKTLKLLVLSAIIALTFSILQAIQGAEDLSTANKSKPSGIQLKRVADVTLEALEATVTTESKKTKERERLAIPRLSQLTVGASGNPFKSCPEEIMIKIFVAIVSLDMLPLDGDNRITDTFITDKFRSKLSVGKLSVVCKGWQSLIKRHKIDIFQLAICNSFLVDKKTCGRFLNGRLIYKPNADNDEGKVELRIEDLANPLKGTFDLSQCGNAGQYLSISMGYETNWRKKEEHAKKIEILFTPRFLVEKEINYYCAHHFKEIFPDEWPETTPVGIFWTWGGWWDWWNRMFRYEYLINQSMDELGNNNLYKKWKPLWKLDPPDMREASRDSGHVLRYFSVVF